MFRDKVKGDSDLNKCFEEECVLFVNYF